MLATISNPARPELRRARRMAGLSGAALARRLRVTPSAVSAWEAGSRSPSAPMIPALADVLQITASDVLALIDQHADA